MPLETVNTFDKKGNEEFKPTAEEMKVIADKMRDPEFAKLMHEYMQSLSDPDTRREEEEYLKQMEREAKEGGDYSFDFIFPKPSYVVQLLKTSGYNRGIKVFINVCESDRVDEFREETTGNRFGSNWHIPVAVSQEREEEFEGSTVAVYDAVFHPKTLGLSNQSDRFLCFLVEIAVEHINAGYKKSFEFEFKRLSSSLKSIGVPKNQTVRKEKGKSAFPLSQEPVSSRPQKPAHEVPSATKSKDKPATNNNNSSKSAQQAVTTTPVTPKQQVPKFTILHKGEIDLIDAWQWKIVDKRVGIPKELVVKIEFPGVTSAAQLEVDVAGAYIDIGASTTHPFGGCIPLPFSVDPTPISAKFDKSKQILSLSLKVVPPERPPEAVTADQMRAEMKSTANNGGYDEEPADVKQDKPKPDVVDPVAQVAPADLPVEEEQSRPRSDEEEQKPVAPSIEEEPSHEENSGPNTNSIASGLPVEKTKIESSHLDGDRASQLMAKLQEARREREAAEAAAALQDEKQKEVEHKAISTSAAASEEAPEVIDLRKKQDEWMASVRRQEQEQELRRQEQEEEEQRLVDEEQRRLEKQARRKLEAEKEAERVEAESQRKMQELPLRSHYIFDIE